VNGCLFIRDPTINDWAVKWRCNRLFVRRDCVCEDGKFNRRHVGACFASCLSTEQWEEWGPKVEIDREIIRRKELSCDPEVYSVLDCLLNAEEFDLFGSFVRSMEQLIVEAFRTREGDEVTI
jgi:hypothetical protein